MEDTVEFAHWSDDIVVHVYRSFENSPINSVDGNARNNYSGMFNVGPNMQYIHLYVLCDDVTG